MEVLVAQEASAAAEKKFCRSQRETQRGQWQRIPATKLEIETEPCVGKDWLILMACAGQPWLDYRLEGCVVYYLQNLNSFVLNLRSAYCAASVASLTNIITPTLFDGTAEWIAR